MMHPGGKNIFNKMMGFKRTVTAREQDTGVVLNDGIDLLFSFSQEKWIEVWNY